MSEKLDIARGTSNNINPTPSRSVPADERIDFCLTQLEEQGFEDGIGWKTEIAHGLTIEEVIGALVEAEKEWMSNE